jgi:LPS export ABC transporter protein LptC
MIYTFFKPTIIEKRAFKEMPLFEITSFEIHELDTKGLKSLLSGSSAQKFSDRYVVEEINYTDNSQKYLANMRANSGIHKEDETTLKGDVHYKRDDGFLFEGQEAKYDKKLALLSSDQNYIIHKGQSNVRGETLLYNSETKKAEATKIKAIYQLQERKK